MRDSRNQNLQQERPEVSKGLLDYIHWFGALFLMCYDPVDEEILVDICIAGMLIKYRPYMENLQLPSFTKLVGFARKTNVSLRKPIKSSTSHTPNVSKPPWKWESKKRSIFHDKVAKVKLVIKNATRERQAKQCIGPKRKWPSLWAMKIQWKMKHEV